MSEDFPSALACAIYSGHFDIANFDTAYALLDLNNEGYPKNIPLPGRKASREGPPIARMLAHAQDPRLLRKAAADGHVHRFNWTIDAKPVEMLDLFVRSSMVPGFPPVEEHGAQHQRSFRPKTDLLFIRRAIDLDQTLLTAKAWDGKTMLDFAVENNCLSLAALYLECCGDKRDEIDN